MNKYTLTVETTDCFLVGDLYKAWGDSPLLEKGNLDLPDYDYATALWTASVALDSVDELCAFVEHMNDNYFWDFTFTITCDNEVVVHHDDIHGDPNYCQW